MKGNKMSKLSQLHAELSSQANDLGFDNIDDAIQFGYSIDYTEGKLVKHECCDIAKEMTEAHEALLKEKKDVIGGLRFVLGGYKFTSGDIKDIEHAIKFIEENVR